MVAKAQLAAAIQEVNKKTRLKRAAPQKIEPSGGTDLETCQRLHLTKLTNFRYEIQVRALEKTKVNNNPSGNLKVWSVKFCG